MHFSQQVPQVECRDFKAKCILPSLFYPAWLDFAIYLKYKLFKPKNWVIYSTLFFKDANTRTFNAIHLAFKFLNDFIIH